jgi:hypothetical protein
MTRDRTPLTPAEEAVRKALQSLPPVPADPEFRDRLERDFTYGAPQPDRKESPRRHSPWAAFLRWAYLPAAAALLLAVAIPLNRGGGWSVSHVREGSIVVDGREFEAIEDEALSTVLGRGGELETGPGMLLQFERPGRLAVEVDAGARVEVPSPPGRWWNRDVTLRVEEGEMRVLTGPAFAGRRLVVLTPESRTEVVGTLISVFRDAGGTCVCVMHGTAMVGPPAGEMQPVPAGMRMVLPATGDPFLDGIMPPHEAGMRAFEERIQVSDRP